MSIFPKGRALISPAAQREIEKARSESRREVIEAVARGRAREELKQEAPERDAARMWHQDPKPALPPAPPLPSSASEEYASASRRLRQRAELLADLAGRRIEEKTNQAMALIEKQTQRDLMRISRRKAEAALRAADDALRDTKYGVRRR